MTMSLFDKVRRQIDPLKQAVRDGMRVGKNVTLASKPGTTFGSEPELIFLDDEVRISGGVHFNTHDGGTHAIRDLPQYSGVKKFRGIYVGKRTFIGYGAIIMPGVHIGERCIIGAGAVVTKDIPDHSVAVGIPARVICTVEEYGDRLMKMDLSKEHALLELNEYLHNRADN